MSRTTMLLFDSLTVRREAVQYAIELAKRTNTGLVLLALLSPDGDDMLEVGSGVPNRLSQFEKSLMGHIQSAKEAGVSAEAIVKAGDPSSELVKFLATSGSLQTIVWGGQEQPPRTGFRGRKPHWLARMKEVVECPVVVPSKKPGAA